LTGKITQLLTQKPTCEERFDNIIGDLETFMASRRLPLELRRKIRNYYKVRYPSKCVFDEGLIIGDIESPFIKKDIVLHLFSDLVSLVPLFKLVDEDVRKEICYKLRSIYRMPGRVVTTAGTVPDSFYFIRFGTVSLKGMGFKPRIITQGDIFGEMALMGLTPNGLRLRTCTAVSVVELCEMHWEDFKQLLVTQKSLLSKVLEVSRMHVHNLKLALQAAQSFDPRSNQPPNDFYDSLSCIEWKDICSIIDLNEKRARARDLDSKFDEKLIKSVEEAGGGHKMMQTSVLIIVRSMQNVVRTGWEDGSKGIIVCSWPGVTGTPFAVQNESKEFRLDNPTNSKLGTVNIRDEIRLAIVHPHDVLLAALPPITVRLFSLHRKPHHDLLHRTISSDREVGRRSKIHPDAEPVSEGQIRFEDWLGRSNQKQQALEYHPVTLTCPNSDTPGVQAELLVRLSFRRRAQREWSRVVPRMLTTGASEFFAGKLAKIFESVENRERMFHDQLRGLRLAAILQKATANSAAPEDENLNVPGKKVVAMERDNDNQDRMAFLLEQLNSKLENMQLNEGEIMEPAKPSLAGSLWDGIAEAHDAHLHAGHHGAHGHIGEMMQQLLTEMKEMKASIEDIRQTQKLQADAMRILESKATGAAISAET
jgi:hypothetical protein